MLTKMRESKGFTLVELMIVVAIIGILAAVAVPYYQRYVAKSRLTSLVIPGAHAIQTSIGTFYAVRGTKPSGAIDNFLGDADTHCFTPSALTSSGDSIEFSITVRGTVADGKCDGLKMLNGDSFTVFATAKDGKLYFDYTGGLADELGL